MASEPVVTPSLSDEDHVLVDWLELVAFFNEFRTAKLDELGAAIEQQFETLEDDDPDEDGDGLDENDDGNIARIDARKEMLKRAHDCTTRSAISLP